jgi:uncharacterized membrane protein YeaQ/YmgE (transglycosylase-associated protein family)
MTWDWQNIHFSWKDLHDFHWMGLGITDLILLAVLAGICGSLARMITGQSRGGCLVSVVVGFIGALLAELVDRYYALPQIATLRVGSTEFPIVWSIVGACLFMTLLGIFTRRRSD